MVVQHNLTAMNSNRMLGITTGTQAKSTEKLSSGYKINRAADDAAGLSISEKMRKQIRGLSQASLNAEDGISAVQTAEGALNEVQDMLQRMNELAVKSANGTMSENDRSYIQNEIDQLVTEIDRVSTTTKFNESYLLKGVDSDGEANLVYDTAETSIKAKLTNMADMDSNGVATASLATANDQAVTIGSGTAATSLGTGYSFAVGNESFYLHQNASDEAIKEAVNGDVGAYTAEGVNVYNSENEFINAVKAAINKNTSNDVKELSLDSSNGVVTVEAFADENSAFDFKLHVGADSTDPNKIGVTIDHMSARGLGVNGLRVDGKDETNATAAIDTISTAIQKISTQRSALGAVQNRLEHTIANLDNVVENTTAAESQIRDTDMATEMVRYSNNNILAQAGQAMLAQANQANQGVLSLLG